MKSQYNQFSATFPNASYYVNRKEYDSALEIGTPSYFPEKLVFLESHDKVVWLEDSGTIDGYIEYWTSSGHSPFHLVFKIIAQDETYFFGGDDAPQLNQMKSKYIAKYDHDGKKAMLNRQSWWGTGTNEGWTFLFYHDIATPLFKQLH